MSSFTFLHHVFFISVVCCLYFHLFSLLIFFRFFPPVSVCCCFFHYCFKSHPTAQPNPLLPPLDIQPLLLNVALLSLHFYMTCLFDPWPLFALCLLMTTPSPPHRRHPPPPPFPPPPPPKILWTQTQWTPLPLPLVLQPIHLSLPPTLLLTSSSALALNPFPPLFFLTLSPPPPLAFPPP